MTKRREFLKNIGVVSATLATAKYSSKKIHAQTVNPVEIRSVSSPLLHIAYEEYGDNQGIPVLLLHGFPYDVRSFDEVVPPLVEGGYRVLLPYLRGFGHTRMRDPSAPRMAEQAALAQDVIDFADALNIERFALAGFDWGNRAACIVSVMQPRRVLGQVAIGGYSIQDTVNVGQPGSALGASRLWYQWYFNTPQGVTGLQQNRHDIVRFLWDTWSPAWIYSDEDYSRSAPSFDNPEFVDITIHSYRHRHMNAPGEERFLETERYLAQRPTIDVPAIVLRGVESGFGRPTTDPAGDRARFTKLMARRLVQGAGHDLPVQRPDTVSAALMELLGSR